MFDLQACVDLQKVERLRGRVVNELHRADGPVGDCLAQSYGRGHELRARRCADSGSWGLLDDLLIASLRRAIALAQCDHTARAIAEDLHFDVPGKFDVLLEKGAADPEILGCQALYGPPRVAELGGAAHQTHADAAAASGALQHHGVADALCLAQRQGELLDQ